MVIFETLSAEVILRILGQTRDAREVVRFRQVNKRMYRLGYDSILWKKLFINDFLIQNDDQNEKLNRKRASKRIRKDEGDEMDPKELLALRFRTLTSLPSIEDDGRRIDWHALYRICSNWMKGSFSIQQLDAAIQSKQKGDVAHSLSSIPDASKLDLPNTIIESTEKFIFTATRATTFSTQVNTFIMVFSALSQNEKIPQVALAKFSSPSLHSRKQGKASISAIAIDRSESDSEQIRLLTAHTNGLLSISTFCPSTKEFRELASYHQSQHPAIVTAAFSWPYLATCTFDFRIRIYRLEGECRQITLSLVEERRSYSCHWPACLRLDRTNLAENGFRLSIVYSKPNYPSSWTVGIQELYLDATGVVDSRSASAKRSYLVTKIDAPIKSNLTKTSSNFSSSTDQVERLTSVSYEEPFVVVGSRDNGVFCFYVDEVTDNNTRSLDTQSKSLSIRYLRTLHGHTGSVHSVSLNGGRCVTGGSDGKVQVWHLGDEETSLARATGVLAMYRGQIRNDLGKVISLRLSDAKSIANFHGEKIPKKRKFSHLIDSDDPVNNTKPFTLADILHYHTHLSTKISSPSRSAHVIRWVTSAFDRIISITSIDRNQTESQDPLAILPASCGIDVQNERYNDEECVQIWNFAI